MATATQIEIPPATLAPADLALRWRDLPGLVFLDSSLEPVHGPAVSIIGVHPVEWVRGGPADWERLEATLKRFSLIGESQAGPSGALVGAVGFEGDFCFGVYPWLLRFDHRTRGWSLAGEPPLMMPSFSMPPHDSVPSRGLSFQAETSKATYCGMVQRALGYIAAGDIYQVNLAHRLRGCWSGPPMELYQRLRQTSPAPYSAFLAQPDRTLLSASPECFLRVHGRRVVTRPIKGTRPRGATPEEDLRRIEELCGSPKERAELVMITDLERNDLGRVCEYGSVRVTDLCRLESYPHVHHLVSTVEGILAPGENALSTLRVCSPGGSISGAPKKRALEIIAELEGSPRGVYTGAIGYLGFNGVSEFNIAIRTLCLRENKVDLWVGAGIVADSDPEMEYEETLHKAAGFLQTAAELSVDSA